MYDKIQKLAKAATLLDSMGKFRLASALDKLTEKLAAKRWFIIKPDGKMMEESELPPRPSNAQPTHGDPFTPWNRAAPHTHSEGGGHVLAESSDDAFRVLHELQRKQGKKLTRYMIEGDDSSIRYEWGEVQYDETSTKSLHALVAGNIIGFLDLMPLPTGEFGIGQITVKRKFRRQGIATELFKIAKKAYPNLVPHSYDHTSDGAAFVNSLN